MSNNGSQTEMPVLFVGNELTFTENVLIMAGCGIRKIARTVAKKFG